MDEEQKAGNRNEPHAAIFGEEFRSGTRHGQGNGIVFGAILLLIGAILLLNNLGIISWEFWRLFWPGLLIILGMRLVLGSSPAGRIVFLLVVLLMFALVLFYGLHQAAGSAFPYGI